MRAAAAVRLSRTSPSLVQSRTAFFRWLRIASREWYEVGRFLGPSIEGFWRRYPLETQLRLWREAGFDHVRWRRMSLGGGIVIWGTRTR